MNVIRLLALACLTAHLALASLPSASAQALMSDQRDFFAHMANAALAVEHCGMRVNKEVLDASLTEVGLAKSDLTVEPIKSAMALAAKEAEISLAALGTQQLCDRFEAMYGATGQRLPGLLESQP